MPRKTRGTTSPQMVEAARDQRGEQTLAEMMLWQALRGNRLDGVKFRRQHTDGPYILDFYCVAHALAIEVDGNVHEAVDQKQHDQERTEYLNQLGITVLRFKNDQVESDLDGVLITISEWIKGIKRPHPPAPTCQLTRSIVSRRTASAYGKPTDIG